MPAATLSACEARCVYERERARARERERERERERRRRGEVEWKPGTGKQTMRKRSRHTQPTRIWSRLKRCVHECQRDAVFCTCLLEDTTPMLLAIFPAAFVQGAVGEPVARKRLSIAKRGGFVRLCALHARTVYVCAFKLCTCVFVCLCICVFVYLCVCVFV